MMTNSIISDVSTRFKGALMFDSLTWAVLAGLILGWATAPFIGPLGNAVIDLFFGRPDQGVYLHASKNPTNTEKVFYKTIEREVEKTLGPHVDDSI